MAKIKPCPFCGSNAEYSEEMGIILCSGCGFYFECPTSLEDSLATWNKRVDGNIPKRKPRMVKIKAWVYPLNIQFLKTGVLFYGRQINSDYVPCHIVINRKYLKEKI